MNEHSIVRSPALQQSIYNSQKGEHVASDSKLKQKAQGGVIKAGASIDDVLKSRLLIQALCKHCLCLCRCLKKNRTERILENCDKRLAKEIDIVAFLKRFRECSATFKLKEHVARHSEKRFLQRARMPLVGSEDNLDYSDCLSQDDEVINVKADTKRDRLDSKFVAGKKNSAGKSSRRQSG